MATLTAEQRKLLDEAGGEVLRLSDPETNQGYVLVCAEVYEQLRSGHADLNPRDLYSALHRRCRTKVGMIRKWKSTTAMLSRGQIVVMDFAVAGMPKKVRPALVVQADQYNRKMSNTVVAMITTNLTRAREPSHLLIDISTSEGTLSGLLHSSVVNCNTLTTIRQDEVLRVLGSLAGSAMQRIDECLKAALAIA